MKAVVQIWKANPEGHWITHELQWGQMMRDAFDSGEPFSHPMGRESWQVYQERNRGREKKVSPGHSFPYALSLMQRLCSPLSCICILGREEERVNLIPVRRNTGGIILLMSRNGIA